MKTKSPLIGKNSGRQSKLSWGAVLGLRREVKRHAAFEWRNSTQKAVSPLRSATAVQTLAPLLLCIFALMPLGSGAATNELSGLLQKGLFEEEANRNLEAAAQAYQTVSAQFDKDRKLAATAIFRLGEIYRKQGKTNEAIGQYERIVREFTDQDTLVTLSRQNLSALGNKADEKSNRPDNVQRRYLEQQSTVAEMEALVAQLKRLDRQELRRVLPKVAPDPLLSSLLDEMSDAVKSYATVLKIRGETDPTTKEQGAKLNQLEQQVDERVDEVMAGLERRLTAARSQLAWLKSQAQPGQSGSASEPVSKAARLEQKRLLEEEISLVEKKLESQQQTMSSGRVSQADILTTQQELLALKRQLVVVSDAQFDSSNPAAEAVTTDDEEKEIRRIQAIIKNSPDLINAPGKNDETLLQAAAGKGQLKVIEFLLDHGAEVNGNQPKNIAPLHYAAGNGHKTVVDLLLQRGAKVDPQTESGVTPLYLAALKGYAQVAKALIAAGAQVDARTRRTGGWTGEHLQYEVRENSSPLDLATAQGSQPIVELLLEAKANPNAPGPGGVPPLINAVTSSQTAMMQLLLDHRADVNAAASNGETALHRAAQNGGAEQVALLLAHKANTNLKDRNGYTPLHTAAANGRADVVAQLITAGADVNSTGLENETGGATPLFLAANGGHREVAKLLLEHGAKPNVRALAGQYGVTPLMRAAGRNDLELVALLLKYKADPNLVDASGSTALWNAVANRNPSTVRELLAGGANPDTQNSQGYSVLILSVTDTQNKEVIKALLDAKPKVNVLDPRGRAPLHYAVASNRKDLIELLLAAGADANLRDNSGKTSLDMVKQTIQASSSPSVGLPRSIPTPPPASGSLRPEAPGSVESKPAEIASLLRQHGALDDLPNLDRIEVRRPSANFSVIAFQMGTNGWNEFGLLELIALQYGLISTERNAIWEVKKWDMSGFWRGTTCQFPDLGRVVIRRPSSAGPQRTEMMVNVVKLLDSGDCAQDVKLKPGDIIEIPEADHPVNESWAGLDGQQLSNLLHCVSRTVTISIKGTQSPILLAPGFKPTNVSSSPGVTMQELTRGSFMLKSVLAQSRLLRASSDLSSVRVTRGNAASGQLKEWLLDCSGDNNPDLWLRDGDVIEVPDKP